MVKLPIENQTLLSNGISMPLLGLGVYNMYGAAAELAVQKALAMGYRLIDTAAMYRNEKEVGNAVRASSIPRDEIFVTSKVANGDQGYDSTLRAFDTSFRTLDIGVIDLYLIHWPVKHKRKDTWKALERLYEQKLVRAIGVANYLLPFLKELETYANLEPMVNQVEFHPYLFLEDLMHYCQSGKIQLQAYSPLLRGARMGDPKLVKLADKYGKSPAQVLLRWQIEHGVSAIPKSSNPQRLKENFDIFDFTLSPEDVKIMDGFHENLRVVEDPMEYW